MSEFLIESSKLIKGLFPESAKVGHGKTVVFQSPEKKIFLGILLEDSVVIPLGIKQPSDEIISNMITLNKSEIQQNPKENTGENVAHRLGLPYNGHTYGLYSDGQTFGTVYALHLYFRDYHETQEKFLEKMTKTLDLVGVKVSVIE